MDSYEVKMIWPYSNNPKDDYLERVIAFLPENQNTPYVVWINNIDNAREAKRKYAFSSGFYCKTKQEAIDYFIEKCEQSNIDITLFTEKKDNKIKLLPFFDF